MLPRQVIALLAVLLTGCTYQPEFGISGGLRQIDGEVTDIGCFDLSKRFVGNQYLKLEHCSDPGSGEYLLGNDKPDVSVETLTYRKFWGGNKR